MANVADTAPVSSQTAASRRAPRCAACSRRRRSISACSACSSPSGDPAHVQHPERRQVLPADQHGHAGGPGDRRRDHRHRDGPRHRVAQHRPVGRVAGRPDRHDLRAAHDRLDAQHPGHRPGLPLPLGSSPWPSGWSSAPADRRAPGLHHRLRRRALLHRHAGRAAVDPRSRLVPVQRRRRVRPGHELPAHRWRGAGLRRRTADLDPRRRRLSSRSSRCSSTAAASVGATDSRSGRCGPRSCSAVVGCLLVLGVAAFANANLWPQGLADRVAAEQNLGPTPAGRLADPDRASRSRSSCSSASRWS